MDDNSNASLHVQLTETQTDVRAIRAALMELRQDLRDMRSFAQDIAVIKVRDELRSTQLAAMESKIAELDSQVIKLRMWVVAASVTAASVGGGISALFP